MYYKRLSLIEAVELTIRLWEHIRDKGYTSKLQVKHRSVISYIYYMRCLCPLCEYLKQREDRDKSFNGRCWCIYKCPLASCCSELSNYVNFCRATNKKEAQKYADLIVKQLRRYASRVLKKKLIV